MSMAVRVESALPSWKKRKVTSYSFGEFMQGERRNGNSSVSKGKFISTLPLLFTPLFPIKSFASESSPDVPVVAQVPVESIPVNAGVDGTMQAKIMTAFEPILDLVQSLAYPVALIVVLGGGLFVMVGNSDKGFSLIQRAGLGYVLVMMLPMLMNVLVDAMSTVT